MKTTRADRVHIWPQLSGEADQPREGRFAIRLGKQQPERALQVVKDGGLWFAYFDGRQLARGAAEWRKAFGIMTRDRDMLTGRVLTEQEYTELLNRRKQDAAAGINADKPINLNTARVPF